MTGSQGIKSFFHRTKSPEPGDDSFIRSKLRRIVAAVPSIPGGRRRRHGDLARGRSTADRPCSPDGTRWNGRTQAWAVPAMQRGDDGRWQPPSLSRGSLSTSALAVYATASDERSRDELPRVPMKKRNGALSTLFREEEYDATAPREGDLAGRLKLPQPLPGQKDGERSAGQPKPVVLAAHRPASSRTEMPSTTRPAPARTSKITFPDDADARALVRDRPSSWQSTPSLTSAETESTSLGSRPSTILSTATIRNEARTVSVIEPISRMSSPTLRIKARRLSEVALLDTRHIAIAEVDDGEADLCGVEQRPYITHHLTTSLTRPAGPVDQPLATSLAGIEGPGQTVDLLAGRKSTYRARPASRRTQSLDVTNRSAPQTDPSALPPASRCAADTEALASLGPARLAEVPVESNPGRMTSRQPQKRHADQRIPGPLRSRGEMPDACTEGDRPMYGQRHSSPASLVNPPVAPQILEFREYGSTPVRYQLGNCIGRGQFGSVYRSLNFGTGQMAAIKRIRLAGMAENQVKDVMREVELLKRLSHPSIVRYEGMSRDDEYLNIVLEFVENGSLGQILKAFGKLNERLVAGYVARILEGLNYLHSEGVVHCDLKAANILSTKNGNVKLSDFGVSLNLKAVENIKQSDTLSKTTGVKPTSDVAGTPNWMAPEVISLDGASPASDIWSLGCTIIELLTGKPPYYDVGNSMSVLFRIVEDDRPPFPPDISDDLADFLKRCFAKSPRNRPTSEALFKHPWIKRHDPEMAAIRPQDSIPFLRRVSLDLRRTDSTKLFVEAEHAVVAETATTQTQAIVLTPTYASERSRDTDPPLPDPSTLTRKQLPTVHTSSPATQHASHGPVKSDCSVQ